MASPAYKFSYYKLGNGDGFGEEAEEGRISRKTTVWYKLRKLARRRRPRIRIPGRSKFLIRKRIRLCFKCQVSWYKTLMKRLKKGQVHLNDLFGGNFLCMQFYSTPFTCVQRASMGNGVAGLPSYSHGRTA